MKFRCEEQSNLNDILLRVSAFGLFIYSVFSVIAGALNAHKDDQNLLVTITSSVAILQVILQLLFIADVSRRRVHLPEQDRTKPARQIVTFLLIINISIIAIYTFEAQKVVANPVRFTLIRQCFILLKFHEFFVAGSKGLLRIHHMGFDPTNLTTVMHIPSFPLSSDPRRGLENHLQGTFRVNLRKYSLTEF